jgi:hypothetical protein
MCTANIVVSLPALKTLLVRSTPTNTSAYSNSGYIQQQSGPRKYSEPRKDGDDEIELVSQGGSRKASLSTTRTESANQVVSVNDVRVTTDYTVERHAL